MHAQLNQHVNVTQLPIGGPDKNQHRESEPNNLFLKLPHIISRCNDEVQE